MRLTVRCGVTDGGRPCGNELGTIDRPGFPGAEWWRGGNYDRLTWEERFWECPSHGTVELDDSELRIRALKMGRDATRTKRRVVMAKRPAQVHGA
jgi:hypothetical protein